MAAFSSTAFSTSAFSINAFSFDSTPPTPGRSGLGGDDVPRKSPHKGWNKEEWKRLKKDPQDAIEATLKAAYAELTGETVPVSVLSQVDAIVRPVATQIEQDIPLRIDWAKMALDYERANALVRLWREEQELLAMIEDDEDVLMLL